MGQLAAGLPVSRSAVSQHLKILKDAGLVEDTAAGTRRIYRLNPVALAALRDQPRHVLAAGAGRVRPGRPDAGRGGVMAQADTAAVRKQVVVDAPIERAFSVFTGRFGDFKPPEHNLLGAPVAETVFEPRVGGGIVDRAADGSECRWARILAFDPPDRVVFSWDISPRWTIETDPAQTSEVEVRFYAESPARTRVELEHRHIDPARARMGSNHRRRGRAAGLAAVPGPVRRAAEGRPLI